MLSHTHEDAHMTRTLITSTVLSITKVWGGDAITTNENEERGRQDIRLCALQKLVAGFDGQDALGTGDFTPRAHAYIHTHTHTHTHIHTHMYRLARGVDDKTHISFFLTHSLYLCPAPGSFSHTSCGVSSRIRRRSPKCLWKSMSTSSCCMQASSKQRAFAVMGTLWPWM